MRRLTVWNAAVAVAAIMAASLTPGIAAPVDDRPIWCPGLHQRLEEAIVSPLRSASERRAPFEKLAAKAARRETITLVAIGSSSTEGSDLSDRTQAYPAHLEKRLNALLGPQAVRVINKGRGGEGIPETVKRFASDVAAERPDLIVWQLGANDIVRRADPSLTARSVEDGMQQLGALDAPVILMDTQTAPAVSVSPALEPVQAVLKAAAHKHGAMFWSRYELMRGILNSRQASDSDLIKPDRLHMTVPMHVCTGSLLADTIAAHMPLVPPQDIRSASR